MNDVVKNTQHLYNLVELCARSGVSKAVVCSGSRCAPLLLGFGKHPEIETISVVDERSAAFIAVGLSQQRCEPVVVVSTSGSAALNFAPAIAEAYYQNVQLIVMTADRPPKLIDQWDGQTIRQTDMYANHIQASLTYTIDSQFQAAGLLQRRGPVHFNIPIDEPFYPESLDEIKFEQLPMESEVELGAVDDLVWSELKTVLDHSEGLMILGGQLEPSPELCDLLDDIGIPVVADVASNLQRMPNCFGSADVKSSPDFLITIGRSIVSKKLRLFLRENKPKIHWHIGRGLVGDPFESLTKTIAVDPELFFGEFAKRLKLRVEGNRPGEQLYGDFHGNRSSACASSGHDMGEQLCGGLGTNKIMGEVSDEFCSYGAVNKVLPQLPENSVLHLGNSMSVRYAELLGIMGRRIDVWSNRGTSGIDGIVSAAVGHALGCSDKKHTLIVGDLSFFYDRNGLWLNHEFPSNLRIIILNDSGGGIFNMIDGPTAQGDLTKLFTMPHNRSAELTAKEFGLKYMKADSYLALAVALESFEAGILEIFTSMSVDRGIYKQLQKERV